MDEADATVNDIETLETAAVAAIREKASKMPKGVEGICLKCDEFSRRLVGGACAPCRDRLGLP